MKKAQQNYLFAERRIDGGCWGCDGCGFMGDRHTPCRKRRHRGHTNYRSRQRNWKKYRGTQFKVKECSNVLKIRRAAIFVTLHGDMFAGR